MKRREFFALAGMAMGASGCGAGVSTIVIGAGLAGLGAAQALQRDSKGSVVVFEARDRLGGRTWTSNFGDVPLDLGASWIHGVVGNPLTELAARAGAQLVTTSTDRFVVYPSETLWEEWQKQIEGVLKRKPTTDRSVEELIKGGVNWQDLTPSDRRIIQSILQSNLETNYGGSARELSALYYDDGDSYAGDEVLFRGGYQTIVNFLAQGLDIRLSHIVSEIDWSGAGVVITTNKGVFRGERAVVTLPLGVLKGGGVKFYPPLPSSKQNAIHRLGMGVLNKCYLEFSQIFWPRGVDWLQQVSPLWTEWVSFARSLGKPILLGFNGGDRGREVEELTDTEIVDSALAHLGKMLGRKIPDPIRFQVTRWGKDPFALGSYSFNPVGYTRQMRADLQAPLNNKLFFAGEATSINFFATAHGALMSGRKAAQEIASLL